MRALDFGKSVCIIEKDKLGGAAVYNGVMSSKTMWEIALKVQEMSEMNKKIHCDIDLTWNDLRERVQFAIQQRKNQYIHNTEILQETAALTIEKMEGEIVDTHRIALKKDGKIVKYIQSDYILVATGSKPRYIPNIAVDEKVILTSDGIDQLEDYPKSIVIVGAGVIGCEFATIFSSLGKTKVYLIDRADRILPSEDDDVSELVAKNLENKGVTIHHNAQLSRLEKTADGSAVEYEIQYENGTKEIIQVEKALLSVGRVPLSKNIGLENVQVNINPKTGCIRDNNTQTNIPNIYTAGDVSGRIALVSVGEIESRHAVERMFGDTAKPLSYDNICSIMFLNPEVAAVGMNEQQCQEKGIPIKVVKMDYSMIPRAIAMGKTQGFFKIIVTHDHAMKILGMRAIGEHASTAIQAIGLLIKMNKGIHELAELIHPHPSIIEGIQECVRTLLNKPIFKVCAYPDQLKCYSNINGVKKNLYEL
jgi:dihydrolipoamide dehydrogenase